MEPRRRWTSAPVRTPDDMVAYIALALAERDAGRALPFATVDRATGLAPDQIS